MLKFLNQFIYQWVDPYTAVFKLRDGGHMTSGPNPAHRPLKSNGLLTAFRGAKRNLRVQNFYDACREKEMSWKRKTV